MDFFGGVGNFLNGAANVIGNAANTVGGYITNPGATASNFANFQQLRGSLPQGLYPGTPLSDALMPKAYAAEPVTNVNNALAATISSAQANPGQVLSTNTTAPAQQAPAPAVPTSVAQPLQTSFNNLNQAAATQTQTQQGLTDAQIKEMSDLYDSLAAKLGLQKEQATNTYNTSTADVKNQFQSGIDLLSNAQTGAQNREQQMESDSMQRFNDIQRQNRMIARSQGSLDSSYYGDLQNTAGLAHGREISDYQTQLANNFQQLDLQKAAVSKQADIEQAKLADIYNNAVKNINIDETLTAQQKADKINTAKADLENRISGIQTGVTQLQTQLGQTQAQIQAQLEAAKLYSSMYGAAGLNANNYQTGAQPGTPPQSDLSGYVPLANAKQALTDQKNSIYNTPVLGFFNRLFGV